MTDLQPAPGELVALAAAVRPDWDRDALANAVLAAKTAGWTWEQVFRYVVRLILREDATPAELRHAAARPARAGDPSPADGEAWAARAREMLLHRDEPGSAA